MSKIDLKLLSKETQNLIKKEIKNSALLQEMSIFMPFKVDYETRKITAPEIAGILKMPHSTVKTKLKKFQWKVDKSIKEQRQKRYDILFEEKVQQLLPFKQDYEHDKITAKDISVKTNIPLSTLYKYFKKLQWKKIKQNYNYLTVARKNRIEQNLERYCELVKQFIEPYKKRNINSLLIAQHCSISKANVLKALKTLGVEPIPANISKSQKDFCTPKPKQLQVNKQTPAEKPVQETIQKPVEQPQIDNLRELMEILLDNKQYDIELASEAEMVASKFLANKKIDELTIEEITKIKKQI